MDAAVEAGDINAFYPLNVEFHAFLVRYSGNDHLVSLLSNVDKQLHLFRRRGLVQTGKMQSSNQEHEQILASLAAPDTEQACHPKAQPTLPGKNRLERKNSGKGK